MIKALFFDIDGTLVSFKTHEIPASTIEALVAAKAKGIYIFISTGRAKVLITNIGVLQQCGLIDGYVTMNGAYCFVGDEVIYKNAIPTSDVKTLTAYCTQRNIPCIAASENEICACQPDERIHRIFHEHLKVTTPLPARPVEEMIRKSPIYQLTPFITKEEEQDIAASIPHSEIGRWHPAFADITAKGCTKQRGIDEIIRHFNIRREETMAFGDGGNDISMLRHAGIGIAMDNANADVKASADYITTSVDDNGIANALKHFGIIGY